MRRRIAIVADYHVESMRAATTVNTTSCITAPSGVFGNGRSRQQPVSPTVLISRIDRTHHLRWRDLRTFALVLCRCSRRPHSGRACAITGITVYD
jgi:hypothetical protein